MSKLKEREKEKDKNRNSEKALVTNQGQGKQGKKRCNRCGSYSHLYADCTVNEKDIDLEWKNRPPLICGYCKVKWHLTSKCYKRLEDIQRGRIKEGDTRTLAEVNKEYEKGTVNTR